MTFHFYFIIRWISSKQTLFLYIGSGAYTKLVKLGQTGALPGQTVVAPPFSGYKRGFTGSNVSIPVTTGANRGATILYRGSTDLTTGHTGGLHRTRFKDVPGMCRYRPDGIPVETRLLSSSSRFTKVFDSLPGKHFKTTGDMSRFIPDLQGCPRTAPQVVHVSHS